MHVALVTDGIWPYVLGGMQKHSYYLCKYLAKNKIEVDLFHFNQSQYKIEQLEFFTEEEKKYIHSFLVDFPNHGKFPGHYIYDSYQYSKRIYNVIESKLKQYDFIYTKGFSGWYLINQKHKQLIQCSPIGVKFHGYEMFQKPPSFKSLIQNFLFLRKPVKSISLKADVVFSYGGKITTIIKKLGVKENQIIELPSGVEESFVSNHIQKSTGKIKILYLGRYERRKGIEELNKAILLYLQTNGEKKLEFNFVGPIPEEKKLLAEKVIYHGEIRDKIDLQNAIQLCDILICPSWSEGMPNVILEGMARGLAIIATDVGATRILVDENNGWLLPEPNVELLKDIFLEINNLNSNMLDGKKSHSLSKIKAEFTWEKLISKLVSQITTIKKNG
jgi:glycosyltransferase involved in cell wall biosynthesis